MHPLHAEQAARMITEDRLQKAAVARRLKTAAPSRPALRQRLGAGLIRLGTRVQGRRPVARPRTASC